MGQICATPSLRLIRVPSPVARIPVRSKSNDSFEPSLVLITTQSDLTLVVVNTLSLSIRDNTSKALCVFRVLKDVQDGVPSASMNTPLQRKRKEPIW